MPIIANARDLGAFIKAERCARGMTQASLAAEAGVGRQWLGEVEAGHDRAEIALVARVLAALGIALTPGPTVAPNGSGASWYPVRSVARLVRDELERSDIDFALRILAQCLGELDGLVSEQDQADHLSEPPSTGDRRWDVLIAAAVRWRCSQLGLQPPDWTLVGPLDDDWWPIHDRVLEARIRQWTPTELASSRVWLDSRALTTR